MNSLIAWFCENRIAANLLMLVILFGGFSGLGKIDKEVQPTVKEHAVQVSLLYPGAGPKEVEEQICVRIEDAIESVQGIDKTTCTASQGLGFVKIESTDGYPIDRLLSDVKSRVDAISSFPKNSERPVIEQSLVKIQVLNIAVVGEGDERIIKELANQIKNELSRIPEIPEVIIQGTRNYEISIEVDEVIMRKYNLVIDDISQAIRSFSTNIGGGIIRSSSGEIQVQVRNQAYRRVDFAEVPILASYAGELLKLGDIAIINDGFVDKPSLTKIDGKTAVLLSLNISEKPDVLATSEAAKNYIEQKKSTLPAGFKLKVWQDNSRYFNDRLSTLLRNGFGGLFLVFILLLLFLRPALAIWVVCGIGVAFVGSLFLLPIIGTSINVMTLFAYIMVLGIVVDDAIIIGESIYTQQQKGVYGVESAKRGTIMMAKPVFFAVLTSIIVFIPLLLLPGNWAYFFGPIATIPVLVLIFSLLESCLILPAHLAALKPEKKPKILILKKIRQAVAQYLRYFLIVKYRPFLHKCIRNRGVTIASFMVFFSMSISLVIASWVKLSLPPDVALDLVLIKYEFTEGIPFNEIEKISYRVEQAAYQAEKEMKDGAEVIETLFVHANNNKISYFAELKANGGDSTTLDFSRLWQQHIGKVEQAEKFNVFDKVTFEDADITIKIFGGDIDELGEASDWLRQRLSAIDGMHSINDTLSQGRRELEIKPKKEAYFFGIGLQQLGKQVRQIIYGDEVQRVARDQEDIRVMVRYVDAIRNNPSKVNDIRVRNNLGHDIPLEEVAEFSFREGYAKILRVNGRGSIEVNANYDNEAIPLRNAMLVVQNSIIKEFKETFPSIEMELGGEQQEIQEFTGELTRLGLFAILIIYGLLAVQFKSILQPLLIIVSIPFSFAGVIWAHLFLGENLSLMSVLGMLAAAGVVVNDTLVLIDQTNINRRKNLNLTHTLISSAKDRFRPIFLTSITTFFGLMPIMLETSTQAKFLIPMAISLAFGVMTATIVTLVLIPCLYSLGHDLAKNVRPFVLKHIAWGWNGEQKLWVCFSAYYFVGVLMVIVCMLPILGTIYGVLQFMSVPEQISIYLAKLGLSLLAGSFLVWALTSTWRCAVNVKNNYWIPIIRLYVVSVWLIYFYIMAVYIFPGNSFLSNGTVL